MDGKVVGREGGGGGGETCISKARYFTYYYYVLHISGWDLGLGTH